MAALIRRIISTSRAPAAIGPYSQAVVVDRTVYISGQLGMDPASCQLVEGCVQAQTRQALENMGEILKAAGCGYENVVKTTVLLADMNDFTNVNDVYKQCSAQLRREGSETFSLCVDWTRPLNRLQSNKCSDPFKLCAGLLLYVVIVII
ncbi:2-iminobutanoate/2-iminopropanoate deaminase-like isoform X2 [Hippoglossus hippoglossus]|uniref:2-iminobutanoate/2-iminopropanoate deaminase-like isoform X2 n=1 Tax=Hippoglossus hippoglossus TaxID=8267 RepID=UPI00148D8576|nr:2-iminobutanoate/2-iminopropanoate deaminase-like isoform X2 [Hippoglossus hippoglossus]